jgi:hypothetical protein
MDQRLIMTPHVGAEPKEEEIMLPEIDEEESNPA